MMCNCEFAAISRYISETVRASAKVTVECEYEVVCQFQTVRPEFDVKIKTTRKNPITQVS